MNILVAGSTGNTGARLVQELQNRGHHTVALVRPSSDTSVLPDDVALRQGDLTDLSDDVTEGCDVVIFAAGSGGDTSAEMTDKVDRDGAIRLIDIAQENDVSRFVMLSSVGAGDPDPDSDLAHYLEAKHAADEHLKNSGLEYAILRPVSLTDDGPTGSVKLGDNVDPGGKAARGDVAQVLADAAEQDDWAGAVKLMETVY
ncbi:SDR family oxidoreductase [Alteriqipengyuania sp. WL0013]|uniref:SDR family oxidoreductase n=1 Tax=Alteriqipengyuania sp. WL0013 TaxID=3110773 RepID=UPI002B912E5C|nr:SDR family oxidoreductase [Alteriqipengyuania sp. WL0013]MEB3415857.1 SDR family oxidoreductase [Alteriqipengyuania sp. WL0013]